MWVLGIFCLSIIHAHGQQGVLDDLRSDVIILSEDNLIRGERETNLFINELVGGRSTINQYEQQFSIAVNEHLNYKIGQLHVDSQSYAVMSIHSQDGSNTGGIELLIIYENKEHGYEAKDLDARRAEWMHLCNRHEVAQLVEQLYTSNTYYYNRGRLLQGTQALTAEYGYMKDPNYSLKLTPKKITFVSPSIAYEIGRCSGSYPNPYMLLWKKTSNGQWQILLDSNY